MVFLAFSRILFLLAFFQGFFVSSAIDFNTTYQSAENLFWQGMSVNPPALSETNKAVLLNNLSAIRDNRGSLDAWSLSKVNNLIVNILNSAIFTAAEKQNYVLLQTALSAPAAPTYQPLSAQLNTIQSRVAKIMGGVSSANDIATETINLQNLLLQLYGSEKDRGLFLMVWQALKNKAVFSNVSTTTLDSVANAAKNITYSNRIQFLERINDANNFTDQAERTLFTNVTKMLQENLDKLSNDEITRMHNCLVAAISSQSFSDDEKKYLYALASVVVDYFNNERLTADSGSSNQVATTQAEQENFAVNFAALQAKFNSIDSLYKQGNQADALSAKVNDFYPMVTSLQAYLGDMLVSDYKALTPLTSGTKIVSLPNLAGMTDLSSIKNEQADVLSFLSSIIASRVFYMDQKRVDSLRRVFDAPVMAETRLQFLENSYASKVLSQENKKRFLWHLYYLIDGIGSSSSSRSLSFDQQNRVANLLNTIALSDYFKDLNTADQPFVNALKNNLNTKISGAAAAIAQGANGKKVVISLVSKPNIFLGVYDRSTATKTDYRAEMHDGYTREIQNVFVVKAGANSGEILLFYDGLSQQNLYLSMSSSDGVAKMKPVTTPPVEADYVFVLSGSSADNCVLKSKGVPNCGLTYFETGVVSAINPVNNVPMAIDSDNQHFKIQILNDFDLLLIAARKNSSVKDVLTSYSNLIGQATESSYKQALVADITFFLNFLISKGLLTQEIHASISELVETIAQRDDFSVASQGIEALKSLLQNTSASAVSAILPPKEAVSDPAAFVSFSDKSKVALQFGNFDSPDVRYLSVIKKDSYYSIKALKTSPANTAAQFIIGKQDYKVFLESVKYPGFVIAYDSNLVSVGQDLNLVQKTSPLPPAALFATVKSMQDATRLCLINTEAKGYPSIMSDGSVMVTNFSQPWGELDSSRFTLVPVVALYDKVISIISDKNLSNVDKVKKISTDALGRVSSVEQAMVVLKEIYGWVLSIKKSSDSWKAFIVNAAGGVADSELLDNKLLSLQSGTLKSFFTPCDKLIAAIKSLLEFNPDSSINIFPTDSSLLWLTDDAYSTLASAQLGMLIAVKTTGVLKIYIDQTPQTFADSGPKYCVAIGEKSTEGVRQAVIYRGNDEVLRVDCKDFSEQNFVEYQLVFYRGQISLLSRNGPILNYVDSGSSLINYDDQSAVITIGFAAEKNLVFVDRASVNLEIQVLDFINKLAAETYSAKISRIVGVISTSRSVSTQLSAAIDELSGVISLPNYFLCTPADLDKLKNSLQSLKTTSFLLNNYSANSKVTKILERLNQPPQRQDRINFLYDFINKMSFYNTYSGKIGQVQSVLQNIFTSNVYALIGDSFDEGQKNEVRNLINGKITTERIIEASVITQLLDAVTRQVKIEIPSGALTLAQRIAQVQTFVPSIQTTDQRLTILNYLDQLVNEIVGKTASERSAISNEIISLQNLLDTLTNNSPIFADILGSLMFMKFEATNFMDLTGSLQLLTSDLSKGARSPSDFMTSLTSLVNYAILWYSKGVHSIHQPSLQNFTDEIVNNVRPNPKLGAYVNNIDVMIGSLKAQGKITNIINDLRNKVVAIRTTSDKDAIVGQVGTLIVSYIESQIALGSVNEDDRAAAKAFVTELQNNVAFKDATYAGTLNTYLNRLSASVDPAIKLDELIRRLSSLAEADTVGIERFLSDLTNLSRDFKSFIASSSSIDSSKITRFNSFIDDIKNRSVDDKSTGVYYAIYLKRTFNNPKLDLDVLKLGSLADYDMINRFTKMIDRLKSDNMSVYQTRQQFIADYNTLINDWKLGVIFDPAKGDINAENNTVLYQKARDFFMQVKTQTLAPFWATFDEAKQDMLEGKFDAIDKATILKTFLSNSGLSGKTVQQVNDALVALVKEFKDYRALIFDQDDKGSVVKDLLTFCKTKPELSTIVTAIDSLVSSITVAPTISDRVVVINGELADSVAAVTLTDSQKTNLISVVGSLVNKLSTSSAAEISAANISGLITNLQSLLNKVTFTSQDVLTMNNYLQSLKRISLNPSTSGSGAGTTVTTPTSQTPIVVIGSNPLSSTTQPAGSTTSTNNSTTQAPWGNAVATNPYNFSASQSAGQSTGFKPMVPRNSIGNVVINYR